MLSHSIRRHTTRCKIIDTFFLQHRHRHQPPHRTINVQLLTDIPGVGRLGSIQSVAPGRMRSVLYPQKKAAYLVKGVAPRLPPLITHETSVLPSSQEEVDFADIKSRIVALLPLVFHRPLRTSFGYSLPAPSSAERQPIRGSVSLHDVAQRLSDSHNLSLVPPDALLSFQEESPKEKIRSTGSFNVLVHLRTGDIASLIILVEPESDSENQTQLQVTVQEELNSPVTKAPAMVQAGRS